MLPVGTILFLCNNPKHLTKLNLLSVEKQLSLVFTLGPEPHKKEGSYLINKRCGSLNAKL